MTERCKITRHHLAWLAAALACSGAAGAQQDGAPNAPAGQDAPASQETEVSEDTYRQYMELEDRQIERAPMPIDAYAPEAGLEKMQQLPEASRKHLRDELRGVILEHGGWQPADADRQYPFHPSDAARANSGLRQQESEAWSELVAEYHQREAAIHAARGQAGGRSAAGTPASAGSGDKARSAAASGAGFQDKAGSAAGSAPSGQPDRRRPADVVPAPPAARQDAAPDAGVTQNALDYLTGAGDPGPGHVPVVPETDPDPGTAEDGREGESDPPDH